MKNSSKKGLFLTIELLIVLLVIVILVIIAFVGGTLLVSSAKQTKIVNEMQTIMEAVINFRSQLGYWPGDIPYDAINKTPSMMNSNVATATQNTQTAGSCVKNAYGNGEVGLMYNYKQADGNNDSTGVEGGILNGESFLVFSQLSQAGYLKGYDVDTTSTTSRCTTQDSFGAVVTNKWYPKAKFDSKLAWVFNVFKSDQNRARFGYVKETYPAITPGTGNLAPTAAAGPTGLFPVAFDAYKAYWNQHYKNQPLLTLFRYSSVSIGAGSTKDISSYLPIAGGASNDGVGALSPELTRAIDEKIDDGRPFGLGSGSNIKGRVTANQGNWTDSNCFTLKHSGAAISTATLTPITTLTTQDLLDAEYNDSKLDNKYMGCVVVFRGLSPDNV